MDYAQQLLAAMYYALVVESETHACSLECHDIREHPNRWQVPLVLFLKVLHPSKSESLYPIS